MNKNFLRWCHRRRGYANFNRCIQVVHQDGSIFVLNYAELWQSRERAADNEYAPKWIGVYTEHNGKFLFCTEDLKDWRAY